MPPWRGLLGVTALSTPRGGASDWWATRLPIQAATLANCKVHHAEVRRRIKNAANMLLRTGYIEGSAGARNTTAWTHSDE